MTVENMMLVYIIGSAVAPIVAFVGAFVAVSIYEKRERSEKSKPEITKEDADNFCRNIDKVMRYMDDFDKATKPAAPKPDAARDCGVVKPCFAETRVEVKAAAKPKYDEPPRRKGRYKVIVSFWWRPDAAKFHDLAEFYRFAEVRKCDFSPSTKMEEDVRLSMIAASIVKFYRERGLTVRAVSLYRKKHWHAFEYDEKGFRK